MIKKIIFLIIILIITLFLLVFYFFDKIYIKKTIANIEDNLNLDISLNTDYEFSFFPNLSLLIKFNLNKKDYNLFIQNAQFYVYKNYDLKPAKFIFNSERIEIENFLIEQLASEGIINQYTIENFISKFEINPKGYINYKLNSDEKNSLKFLSLIFKRLNLPNTYKKLFDFSLNTLLEKTYFTSKIIFDEDYLIIDNFNSIKNDFNFDLNGTYNLNSNILDININLNHKNEQFLKLKITEDIKNPNIKIVSDDNSINYNFSISEVDKFLEGGIDNILKNLNSNE